MKIAITADLHFRSHRLIDIQLGWEELLEKCITYNIDTLIIAGDVFETYNIAGREASFGTVYNAFMEKLYKRFIVYSHGNVYIIPGNHDIAGQSQRDALTPMEQVVGINIIREPGAISLRENNSLTRECVARIQFLPWLYNNTKSHLELIPVTTPGVASILIGHCEVAGTQVHYNHKLIGGDFSLPKEAFENKGYDYIGLGHIHKRMDYYIGAPWQQSFGDAGSPTGFEILDIESGVLTKQWVELFKAPKYIIVDADAMKTSDLENNKDYINLKYSDIPPEISTSSTNITLEKVQQKEESRTRSNITINAGLKEMLAEWSLINNTPDVNVESILLTAQQGGIISQANHQSIGSINKISKITLNNIGPHKHTEICFGDEKFIAISGHNGAGKTFAIESIPAVLSGVLPSLSGALYNHITLGWDKEAKIELEFYSSGKKYKAYRVVNNKGAHKAFLECDGIILAGPKVSDFDREIRSLVGDIDMVLSSVFFSQFGENDIVDVDPSSRQDIFGRLIGINHFSDMHEKAKEFLAKKTTELMVVESKIKEIEDRNLSNEIIRINREMEEIVMLISTEKVKRDELTIELDRLKDIGFLLQKKASDKFNAQKELGEIDSVILNIISKQKTIQSKIETAKSALISEPDLLVAAKNIADAKREYEIIQADINANEKTQLQQYVFKLRIQELNLVIETARSRIQGKINDLKLFQSTEKLLYEKEIEKITECIGVQEKYKSKLKEAGCANAPLPCIFIKDAIGADDIIKVYNLQIETTKADYDNRVANIEFKINDLIDELNSVDLCKDGKLEIETINTQLNNLLFVIVNDRADSLRLVINTEFENNEKLKALQSHRNTIVNSEYELSMLNDQLGIHEKRQIHLQILISDYKHIDRDLLASREKWTCISKQRDSAISLISGETQRLENLKSLLVIYEKLLEDVAVFNVELIDISLKIHAYKIMISAFSKSGIPQMLIDSTLPQLHDILDDLTMELGGKYSIRFKTQAETKDGRVKETLTVLVKDHHGERDIKRFSGGERKLLKSIIRVAIAIFQSQRQCGRYEVFVADEIFDSLDNENASKLLQLLSSRLYDRFNQVFIIAHNNDLLQEFPMRINFEESPNGSVCTILQ